MGVISVPSAIRVAVDEKTVISGQSPLTRWPVAQTSNVYFPMKRAALFGNYEPMRLQFGERSSSR